MNIRLALMVWLVLGVPLWHGLITGSLDPDEAALRLVLAGVLALVVESLIRTFVTATRSGPPARLPVAADDTSSDRN